MEIYPIENSDESVYSFSVSLSEADIANGATSIASFLYSRPMGINKKTKSYANLEYISLPVVHFVAVPSHLAVYLHFRPSVFGEALVVDCVNREGADYISAQGLDSPSLEIEMEGAFQYVVSDRLGNLEVEYRSNDMLSFDCVYDENTGGLAFYSQFS